MLKRYQILLNDWLSFHLQEVAKKYDLSHSELIRILLCLQIIKFTCQAYPNAYKCPSIEKEILEIIKTLHKTNTLDEAKLHDILSRTYFEARKATEVWKKQEVKKKKKLH